MSYLSLPEAARYVTHKSGIEIEPSALIRMGALGHMLIVAYFDVLMRNLTAHKNDEIAGHLIVPPRHLAAIENEGEATIECAFSLDGKTAYSPQQNRTREQLRVLVSELDRIIPTLRQLPGPDDEATDAPSALTQHPMVDQTPPRFAQKSHLQGEAILKCIEVLGHTASALPRPDTGKPGVKTAVWGKVKQQKQLFVSKKVFDKAWDRLRCDEKIKDAP